MNFPLENSSCFTEQIRQIEQSRFLTRDYFRNNTKSRCLLTPQSDVSEITEFNQFLPFTYQHTYPQFLKNTRHPLLAELCATIYDGWTQEGSPFETPQVKEHLKFFADEYRMPQINELGKVCANPTAQGSALDLKTLAKISKCSQLSQPLGMSQSWRGLKGLERYHLNFQHLAECHVDFGKNYLPNNIRAQQREQKNKPSTK